MAQKTIRHVLTHWARETSLASCWAARDNRLPVLVSVKGKGRLFCMCVYIPRTPCVWACLHVRMWEERRACVSGGCAALRWLFSLTSSASPCFAKHQKCYLKVLLWPFPAPRGKLFTRGALQFWVQWHTPTVTEESLNAKDTRLTGLNKAHQISDPLRMSQKKQNLII